MASPVVKLVGGVALATVLAVVFLVPSVSGVSTWKWVLAAVGLVLFVLAGRKGATRS
jgi:uncharacterized membrane protein YeiH